MNEKIRQAPPRATAMLEALRGLGYSTAAALADLIDNSISAGAREVDIVFSWRDSKSCVYVLDNGCGMNDAQLESAMRLGEKNPLAARATTDLGRFGMGLKTASFSQCRRLTVASRRDEHTHCLRWDLDALASRHDDGWFMFEGPADDSEDVFSLLEEKASGTLVLWEVLDRIVTAGYKSEDFLDLMDRVESHLAMVFHRFIEEPKPKMRLSINARRISPWDPFMLGHPAKPWNSPIARQNSLGGKVEVECHVLPHKDRLSQSEFDEASGPEGWTAQQGFYVYRNERLLVAGGWLGLGQGRSWNKEESHRLARIRLDIPNSADALWKIDIRKSIARPPVSLKPWLTQLAEDTRVRARKVFAFRGSPTPRLGGTAVEHAWRSDWTKSGTHYRIDDQHPAIKTVLDSAGALLPLVKAMLRVIEETVPVQRIWLDTAENKDTPKTQFLDQPPANVMEVLQVLFEDMVSRKGLTAESAKRLLSNMEPFHNYPSLVEALRLDELPSA
ncbi:ATP-binding protein [Paraburkholderia sp. GAS82]|uniref:ATP-binding protein n=1 Tax=Paraburkholderia sp. GAS82 TaxID=3035137 RepID=UPI003D253322